MIWNLGSVEHSKTSFRNDKTRHSNCWIIWKYQWFVGNYDRISGIDIGFKIIIIIRKFNTVFKYVMKFDGALIITDILNISWKKFEYFVETRNVRFLE